MLTLLLLLILAVGGFTALLVISISIVEAPWPVLLGILVVGLLFIRWESSQGRAIATSSQQHQAVSRNADPSSFTNEASGEIYDKDAARIYRGVHYTEEHSSSSDIHGDDSDAPDSPETAASNQAEGTADASTPVQQIIEGVYRGRHWRRNRITLPIQNASAPDIIYRGQKVSRQTQSQPSPSTDASDIQEE